jgi:signal peptidase I
MNLALILVVLTAVSGVVLLVDKLLKRKRISVDNDVTDDDNNIVVEYARSFFTVLHFVLVIRSFVFEPFRIPSGSMMPTLLQGDFIFVKKYSYGLRLPVLETKFIETGMPERGDVVVFRLPSDPSINYIKRVVGLPGDEVVYAGHRLTINGEVIDLERDELTPDHDGLPRFVEALGEREHAILIANPGFTRRDGVYTVEDGHYFMMGDNRDNSSDSRVIGTVPETHLVGEAVRIWMHMDGIEVPDWARIGMRIE